MQRREFITVLGGAAVAYPFGASAQQGGRLRQLGVLIGGDESDAERQGYVAAFRNVLQSLGWADGRNLRIDLRWAGGDVDRARAYAVELVALKSEVLFGDNTFVVTALQQATRDIPIVFARVTDPIASGFANSLARPGGNITGFTDAETSARSKLVELMREMVPSVTRVAILSAPSRAAPGVVEAAENAALVVGLRSVRAPVQDAQDFESTIAAIANEPNSGLIIVSDPFAVLHRKLIVDLAAHHRLPAIYGATIFVTDGGLMSYGVDQIEQYRGAAGYVDRIFKGAKSSDLPVQGPIKYRLVVNMKAARALGLDMPMSILVRIDEVIE